MYHTLFSLSGLAMLGWALLIFLPGWRFTRLVAQTAVFPLYLSVLYAVGVVSVFLEMGPGFMADFGSAEGVLALLATGPVALVAWIHILAFDQVVGVLIFRDNMRGRFVPLPVQSVLLLATLMLGPLGFLTYWAIRSVRRGSARVAWGDAEQGAEPGAEGLTPPPPVRPAAAFRAVVQGDTPLEMLLGVWRREPVLVKLAFLGFAFAVAGTALAASNGGWLLAPEGRLLEAVKFDLAIGIFLLTLALVLPFAPFSERGRRRWVRWAVGLTVFAYAMENVQAWRGLDPRFSAVAGPVDQMLGGVFLLAALGLMVLFIILFLPFFRGEALSDHPTLRLALRYGGGAAMFGFGAGVAMSVVNGRSAGAAGDLMMIHAAGFHAVQAVPLVALLAGAGALPEALARRWTHLAGAGWLLLCVGLAVQAWLGRPPTEPALGLSLAATGFAVWGLAVVVAMRGRRRVRVAVT